MKLIRIVHAVKHTDHGPVNLNFRAYTYELTDLTVNRNFGSSSPGVADQVGLVVLRIEDVAAIVRLTQYDLGKLKKDGIIHVYLGRVPFQEGSVLRRVVPLDDVGHLLKLDWALAGERFTVHKVEFADGATVWHPGATPPPSLDLFK